MPELPDVTVYKERLEAAGLLVAGTSPDETLAEIVEIPGHPFFLAVQFHPEFQSKPNKPHPLFKGFVAAALAGKLNRGEADGEPESSAGKVELSAAG